MREDIIKKYAHAIKYGTSRDCAKLVREGMMEGMSLEELNSKAKELNSK